ncbi:MAG: peroxide stress protein YaaA [Pseudomonadales bacterium]|nr:peroxide stress protein YaaA [Pseudomonadales bacterium]
MLTILSPAKNLDFETIPCTRHASQPEFVEASSELVGLLRPMTAQQLGELMQISPRLAELNQRRYQQWQPRFEAGPCKQALLAFAGEVYVGLEAASLSEADLLHAQQHLRILSGLYGLLRPLDLIHPYRLEMGTPLANPHGRDLYHFWGDRITDALNRQLGGSGVLINLASQEYFKAVQPKRLAGRLITPQFKDYKGGTYRTIGLLAKRARGAMARAIILNRWERPDALKTFDWQGYRFNAELSSAAEWVFSRRQA